jgi:hypothetical protein
MSERVSIFLTYQSNRLLVSCDGDWLYCALERWTITVLVALYCFLSTPFDSVVTIEHETFIAWSFVSPFLTNVYCNFRRLRAFLWFLFSLLWFAWYWLECNYFCWFPIQRSNVLHRSLIFAQRASSEHYKSLIHSFPSFYKNNNISEFSLTII